MVNIDTETAEQLDDITPTDARILDALEGGRNVPSNIADEIDRHRKHVSARLAHLRRHGLIRQVGRDSISLHEITDRGRNVLTTYTDFRAAIRTEK